MGCQMEHLFWLESKANKSMKSIGRLVFGLGCVWQLAAPALLRADGVAQVMTSKSIPPATVAVIDPESGTSTGGGTTDVRIAPGDVILSRFNYFPVPDKIIRGLQGYLTEYIPANTEVVGFRLIDENGLTIPPRYPGLATNGCGRPCNGFNNVPCSAGAGCAGGCRNLDHGSIS